MICCSNAAARRDVVEKTWSRDLGETIWKEYLGYVMRVRSYLTFDVVEVDKMAG